MLLPSTVTADAAQRLQAEANDRHFEVRPLPERGAENDADACFAHFAAEVERLFDEGFAPDDIWVDFTRGTKAMSAALVLAAVAHDLSHLRYIYGKRDQRGTVTAGTEKLREINPVAALSRRRFDLARGLVANGAFAAALDILPDPDSPFASMFRVPSEMVRAARTIAEFLAAWDRLDYRAAAKIDLPEPTALPAAWRPLCPGPALVKWVQRLASKPEQEEMAAMAAWLRPLAVDLLTNAERRVRHKQFEDALVRAYRVLELVGQARLFDHGIDSEAVPENHPAVQKVRERRRKRGDSDFGRGKRGLQAPRELAAFLLEQLKDPLGERLRQLIKQPGGHAIKGRNVSILIHGYDAQGPRAGDDWRAPARPIVGPTG